MLIDFYRFGLVVLGVIWAIAMTVAPANAGVTKLNTDLIDGGTVSWDFQFSPDGEHVLYLADQETNDVFELYSVPSKGGTPLKLNAELAEGGDVDYGSFQFSPDGLRVLYSADQETNDVWESYSVPSNGGTPVKLVAVEPVDGEYPGENVDHYSLQFSPDGLDVLLSIAKNPAKSTWELYSVPSTGGTPLKLNADLVDGGTVSWDFQFSPNGSLVLYRADQEIDDVFELYSVSSYGGIPVKLNAELVDGGIVSWGDFQFSPNGSLVLYRADQETNGVFELYSVPSEGGAPIRLNAELVNGGDVDDNGLQFSPDGSRVLYLADQETNGVDELYSVPSEGGTPIKLNAELVVGGNVDDDGLQFSPDGSRVLYLADQETNGIDELYSVPSEGGTPVKLNADLVDGGEVSNGFQFSPNGSRVLYLADQETNDIDELYSVPDEGGTPVKLNADLVDGGEVSWADVQFSPDGSRVLYLADQDTRGIWELYSRVVSQKWNAASGQWDEPTNWDQGEIPDVAMSINIHPESFVIVTGPTSDIRIFSLDIGAMDTGVATLDLKPGVSLTVLNHATISNRGALAGSGHFHALGGLANEGHVELDGMTIASPIITNSGVISGSGVVDGLITNSGRIEVISEELKFLYKIVNAANGGNVMGRNATLRFDGGVINQGDIGLSFGTSDIFGNIDNDGGTIIISGASNVTFYDDLINDGILKASDGSTVVHFGSVSGNGSFVGSGTNLFEGHLSPGSSPGAMVFSGDVVLGESSSTRIELGGIEPGEFDQLKIAGSASLAATLDAILIEGFYPSLGQTFTIISADGGVTGTFDTANIPALDGGLSLEMVYHPTVVALEVISNLLLGDANNDTQVTGADLVIAQQNFGNVDPNIPTDGLFLGDANDDGQVTGADLIAVQQNFGNMLNPAGGSIPEPGTIGILTLGWLYFVRR